MELNNATQEIPGHDWPIFANVVSKFYQGWDVTLEVLSPGIGDQAQAKAFPFQGLSFEYKGGSADGDLLIEAGDKEPAYETHRIHKPLGLRMVAAIPGVDADIAIDDREGTTTLLRLRNRPSLPLLAPPYTDSADVVAPS